MVNQNLGAVLGLILLSHFSLSQTTDMTPQEVYQRCYIRLVRTVPLSTDPLLIKVTRGETTAAEACLSLFDKALFSNEGILKQKASAESMAILKTLHDQHRSWFQSKIYQLNVRSSGLILDLEEPALYFTRAALLPQTEVRSVLTHSTSLRGLRERPNQSTLNNFGAQLLFSYPEGFSFSKLSQLSLAYRPSFISKDAVQLQSPRAFLVEDSLLVQSGNLVGIAPAPPIYLDSYSGGFTSEIADVRDSMKTLLSRPFNLTQHFGGGVIGSQVFLMNNANLTQRELPNGARLINRRLSARIFEDLLCHELPTLESEDVTSEVNSRSEYMFQQSRSCMRCHSSIDGMGYAFRNLVVHTSAAPIGINQTSGVPFSGFLALPTSTRGTTFAVQVPNGRLHYRELITKKKITYNVSSLQQIGTLLSQHQDFYTCTAKRYYRFLTGIDVQLKELSSSPLDRYHQDTVVKLGKSLKEHQSVRRLFFEIFSSKPFQTRNYETTRSQ